MSNIKLTGMIFLSILLTKCAGTKFNKDFPFIIKSAEKIEDLKTTEIIIGISGNTPINFKNIFYQDKKAKVTVKDIENQKLIIATFYNNHERDFNLSSDPKEEFGNKLLINEENKLFKLKENQAVLSYKQKGKVKFVKIDKLSEKNIKKEYSNY